MTHIKLFFALSLALLISGCASVSQPLVEEAVGVDGIACAGEVIEPPKGLVAVEDSALLASVLKPSGDGMLCTGKVFEVKAPVTVYRVWNGDKDYTRYGRWWSFNKPHGPKDKYREENEICPSWSSLDRMSYCQLKVGSRVVVGPGQSATCKAFTYDKSPVNQVYIPNDSRNNMLYVEACSEGVAWP